MHRDSSAAVNRSFTIIGVPHRGQCQVSVFSLAVGARFGNLLRVPDGKARFPTPKCDQRGVRREEDEAFSFGHAQQQAVERITVRLRSFYGGQDVFVSY
ncbi:MAG TPA: hypothetical protein VH640_09510 [Bryobacteraceae bacterium]